MKNFKINMNRNSLSPDDITKGKNFDQVLKNYSAMKPPFFKTPKLWFGASAVLVTTIAALVLYTKLADSVTSAPEFINPPIAEVNIKQVSYIINAGSDSTITYNSGSKIHIPANAFLDKNGQPVKGNVDLHYREFKKPSEVFLSGIPMTYDSAGQQFHFETAGMMEIGASQNGNALNTNPNALITVDMVSANKDDRFNTYYLDTVEKKWKYLEQSNYVAKPQPSTPGIVSEMQPLLDSTATPVDAPEKKMYDNVMAAKKEIAKLEKEKPVAPKGLTAAKPHFTIKVDEKEFPEIAVYSNVKFQVEDKSYNEAKADRVWANIEMKKIAGTLNYAITFINPNEKYTVIASPVFADKDYAGAKQIYDAKFKEYETALSKRRAEEERLAGELQARVKEAQEKMEKERAALAERMQKYEAGMAQNELIFRTFQVARFGIWNSDCPNSLPKGACVVAKLTDSKTKSPIQIQTVYLVEKGRNAMFTYYPGSLQNFRFDPSKDNMIWAVTSDLKVAVIKPEQFKSAQKSSGEMDLELNVIDKSFKTSDEARAYLEI